MFAVKIVVSVIGLLIAVVWSAGVLVDIHLNSRNKVKGAKAWVSPFIVLIILTEMGFYSLQFLISHLPWYATPVILSTYIVVSCEFISRGKYHPERPMDRSDTVFTMLWFALSVMILYANAALA